MIKNENRKEPIVSPHWILSSILCNCVLVYFCPSEKISILAPATEALTWLLAQRPCKRLNLDAAGPKVETLIVGWFDWDRGLLENVITGEELKTLAGRMVNLG